MTPSRLPRAILLPTLDAASAALVRLSARVTAGTEEDMRVGLAECRASKVPTRWIEELVLQSYLFAGFPRALNAAREWRRALAAAGSPTESGAGSPSAVERSGAGPGTPAIDGAPGDGEGYADVFDWRVRGEETCAIVYGESYEKLRGNIRALHPSLDEWMIVEGYGKVLSRPGLDLARRELCVIGACAAAGQDRQLHSHLHGALHAGASRETISATLDALDGVVAPADLQRARLLWARVEGK